jgi:hypothetical protein
MFHTRILLIHNLRYLYLCSMADVQNLHFNEIQQIML